MKPIDRARWNQLDLIHQMGNIGSEVGRTLAAKRRGADYWPALTRALDLFDATLEPLIAIRSHRSKEIMRAKHAFLEAVTVQDDPRIETYFMQFAIAARREAPPETRVERQETWKDDSSALSLLIVSCLLSLVSAS